jgi:hypothetical protein
MYRFDLIQLDQKLSYEEQSVLMDITLDFFRKIVFIVLVSILD